MPLYSIFHLLAFDATLMRSMYSIINTAAVLRKKIKELHLRRELGNLNLYSKENVSFLVWF